MTFRAAAADTLLILGDSLSAGYRMSATAAWPALLDSKWQQQNTRVINASISGDTAPQGLARLPALLKQHQPRWVLIELGGNDGPARVPAAGHREKFAADNHRGEGGKRSAAADADTAAGQLRPAV